MKIKCFLCGKEISTELPKNFIFRGVAECPECIIKRKHTTVKPISSKEQKCEYLTELIEAKKTINKIKINIKVLKKIIDENY